MEGELAPTPVSYDALTRSIPRVICSAKKGYFQALRGLTCFLFEMFFEGFLVILNWCLFWVERLKESLARCQVVVEPLTQCRGEECASKVILFVWVVGGAASNTHGGRATLQKRLQQREFDFTKGYPGEDIQQFGSILC